SEMMKNVLKSWTNYLDMEKIVAPWAIHAKLKGEHLAHSLTIAPYVAELSHTYALKKKHKMLVSFERMLADTTVPDNHKEWIQQKLKKRNTKKLLKKSKGNIKFTRSYLKGRGEDIKSAVENKTKERLQLLRSILHNANEFHADNFDNKKTEFEKEIVDGSVIIDEVIESGDTFDVTFCRLKFATADNDQKDLVQKWNEEERNQTD
ncbi:hypothetical protein MKX01_036758, partial [Papaver californicum]